MSIYPCLSVYLSTYISVYLPVNLLTYLSINLSTMLPLCLPVRLSIYLSVSLSFSYKSYRYHMRPINSCSPFCVIDKASKYIQPKRREEKTIVQRWFCNDSHFTYSQRYGDKHVCFVVSLCSICVLPYSWKCEVWFFKCCVSFSFIYFNFSFFLVLPLRYFIPYIYSSVYPSPSSLLASSWQ